ncbi:SDR family oxidoreductase [Phenylobacterium sp.]|uniref:SDR family NAD(P)-dependent oxidoreductase n=1 Tax=Phenylobacterium sp. TaxID=1871053 RepID=UPI002F40E021
MNRLAGQSAVVVGASRGIGKAIALALAAEGAHVTAVARREGGREFPGSLPATIEEIRAAGGDAEAACCDIADSADVAALVEATLARRGRIDVLVNSAVYIAYERLLELTDAAWARGFAVNVTGAFYLTRAVAPSMIARRSGRIIHLTGSGAREVGVVSVLTGASKAALERFVRGAAHELAPHKVAVNLFDPGGVKTERAVVLQGADRDWSGFATPAQVAPAAVHLALQDADAMTGQIYSYRDFRGGRP